MLRVLDWRLRSISPFCYLSFFAIKIDPTATYAGFLASRAKEIILSTIQGIVYIIVNICLIKLYIYMHACRHVRIYLK